MRKLDGCGNGGAKGFLDAANQLKVAAQEKKNSVNSKFSVSFRYSEASRSGDSVGQGRHKAGSELDTVVAESTVTCGCFGFLRS